MIDITYTKQKNRLLVILEPFAECERLLRASMRRAEREGLDCEVILAASSYFNQQITIAEREILANFATQAEQAGAIVTYLRTGVSTAREVEIIVSRRAAEGITIRAVKVGVMPAKYIWEDWLGLRQSLHKQLQRKLGKNIPILSVPLGFHNTPQYGFFRFFYLKQTDIIFSLLMVALATCAIEAIKLVEPEVFGMHNRNKTMIYLIACMVAAGRNGFLAGIIASTASFLVLSMLYIAPYYSLLIDDPADAMSLALFTLAGLVISVIGNKDYGSRLSLAKSSNRFHSLLKVHRIALNKNSVEEAIAALDEEVKKLLGTEVVFWVPSAIDRNLLETFYRSNEEFFRKDIQLSDADSKALAMCWETSKISGAGSTFYAEKCTWRFEPLLTAKGEVGVLGIKISPHIEVDEDFNRLIAGIGDQVALIIERLHLEKSMEDVKIQSEKEKLRTMLLSSVSHDLKTPLASIIGSLSVFRSMANQLSEEHRSTLIDTALEESQRLDSFITNILEMTRIESGKIDLKPEWVNPTYLVEETVKRLRDRLRYHPLSVIPPQDNRWEVLIDTMMAGQIIQNLLDNAAKYTPRNTQIDISWSFENGQFALSVRDHGGGIPEAYLNTVFDKYARIRKQDTQVAGTGLGLAIAKAVMHAQGGAIKVGNHPDGGAIFTITLPNIRRINTTNVA